ncbi:Right handed beta helix region [Actinopolyspora mzabensis]|uniref:Right handed beta helix region n=1 Tax=Actinopolyspora mzabensis TaxID=995066 RepID=A0A1G8YR68_ACTMZ|nr:right-handed parallel beta-helix repeat-containing protein [Actinopolyspora mzabensis]SDK05298.1 Right handed beta helix region [Actinopolyspora mzabensis]
MFPLVPRTKKHRNRLVIASGAILLCAAAVLAGILVRTNSGTAEPVGRHPLPDASPLPTIPGTTAPVSPDALFVATDGSDDAAGTRQAPLRTLWAAVDRAGSPSTIVLREGTYRESVGIVRKRLRIRSFPGEQVWLKGSEVVADWTRTERGWLHRDWSPGYCRDCFLPKIIDSQHPNAGLPDMVFLDGEPLRQVAEREEVSPGTFHVDTGDNTLLLGSDPTGKTVEASVHPWLLQFDGSRAAGSRLLGVGIAHYASRQEYGRKGAMVVVNAADVVLRDNAFAWSASSGVAVFAPNAEVDGNIMADNGLVGLMSNKAHDVRLVDNRVVRNNRERFALSGPAIGAGGVKMTRTRGALIEHNSFVNNIGTGWWCDLGCTDATVVHNTTRDNAKHGFYYEVSSRALFASNLVSHNDRFGVKISSADHVGFRNNTFWRNHGSLGIYNDPRPPSSDPYSHQLGQSWITADTEIVNNLFAGTARDEPFIRMGGDKAADVRTPAFVSRSDGNVYLRGNEPYLAEWYHGDDENSRFESLAELTEATGQGEHSTSKRTERHPFRAPEGGDFRLRDGAVGFRAGRPLPEDVAEELGVPAYRRPDVGLLTDPGARGS